MTPRELFKNTITCKNYHERAPRQLGWLGWMLTHHKADLEKILTDFPIDNDCPQTIYRERSKVSKSNLVNGIGTSVDSWGCKWTMLQAGYTGEIKDPIVTDDDWEDIPQITIPEENLSFDIDQVNASCALKQDKYLIAPECISFFERLQYIRGTENLYMDLVDPPTGLLDFMDVLHDYNCRVYEKWAQPRSCSPAGRFVESIISCIVANVSHPPLFVNASYKFI